MLIKKFLAMSVLIALMLTLCGCDFFTMETEQMLTPPMLIGDMAPIQEVIKSSIKGEYTLKYPSSGEYRSAVILNDIDSDGKFEAFVLYSQTEDDVDYMHLNFIKQKGGEWVSIADKRLAAVGVERVDFADLNKNGFLEIIVGFEIYGSTEKQLNVYSLENDAVIQRLTHEYTSFLCCDLDENDEKELFVHLSKMTDAVNIAYLYSFDIDGKAHPLSSYMDTGVRTASSPVLSTLSNGQPAIYIDETKATGNITEVLYLSKGELINPLLDAETKENTKTLRTSNIPIGDINGDKIIEIPVSELMASYDGETGGEKVYYTNWCSFNGENLAVQQTTLLNTTDGYYLSIPEKWINNITLVRESGGKSRMIYAFDTKEKTTGENLAFYTAVTLEEWDDYKEKNPEVFEITRNGVYVFAGKVYKNNTDLSITEQELKNMLFLY